MFRVITSTYQYHIGLTDAGDSLVVIPSSTYNTGSMASMVFGNRCTAIIKVFFYGTDIFVPEAALEEAEALILPVCEENAEEAESEESDETDE